MWRSEKGWVWEEGEGKGSHSSFRLWGCANDKLQVGRLGKYQLLVINFLETELKKISSLVFSF